MLNYILVAGEKSKKIVDICNIELDLLLIQDPFEIVHATNNVFVCEQFQLILWRKNRFSEPFQDQHISSFS